MTTLTSPLKYHGGKSYLAPTIVSLIPPHLHYVEPYAGGLNVMFALDPEGRSEVVNDINWSLTNFWKFLASDRFDEFQRAVEAVPFSQPAYQKAAGHCFTICPDMSSRPCLNCAVAFFILCRQSLAGRMKSFAPLSRTRTRRGMNEQASAWLTAIEGLPAVHARLKRVVVLCDDAVNVIRAQDGPGTFFYLDPPYLAETRTASDVYTHEMSVQFHERLLNVLSHISGKFILSGYAHPLYDGYGWTATTVDTPNHAAGGAEKRRMKEILWRNF